MLPRYCKICRLLLHYPTLDDKEYDTFNGTGFCPDKHYEVLVHDDNEGLKMLEEKMYYNEYMLLLNYIDNLVEIYKDNRSSITITMDCFEKVNYKDKNYVINKLDTLLNFS